MKTIPVMPAPSPVSPPAHAAGSCASCDQHTCALNAQGRLQDSATDEHALLLSHYAPSLDEWVVQFLKNQSLEQVDLYIPGHLRRKPPSWQCVHQCRAVHSFVSPVIWRALALRWQQWRRGPRQAAWELFERRLARRISERLPPSVRTLTVSQDLLPFLQQMQTLGGREYDVLMHRPARSWLQGLLDEAQQRYPDLQTLSDFRSPPAVNRAEDVALAQARSLVTSNYFLAGLYPQRSVLISQGCHGAAQASATPPLSNKRRIAFLGPTLGRNGAGLVRDVMREVQERIIVFGANLESADFWSGVVTEERPLPFDPVSRALKPEWLQDVGLLLVPRLASVDASLVKSFHQQGITVVTTPISGLTAQPGIEIVEPFDRAEAVSVVSRFVAQET